MKRITGTIYIKDVLNISDISRIINIIDCGPNLTQVIAKGYAQIVSDVSEVINMSSLVNISRILRIANISRISKAPTISSIARISRIENTLKKLRKSNILGIEYISII